MKRIPLAPVSCAMVWLLPAAGLFAAETKEPAAAANHPTAYTALRAVQKALGEKALEQVVEVTGREGVPQPYLWHVTLREPNGTREVDVAGGKITGQRTTPGRSVPGGGTLHLQDLNLDSSGAFDAADAQARKVRVRFDSINYVLQIGETGKPAWTLELFNQDGSSVGKMHLAAHDGTIASITGRLANMPIAASTGTITTTGSAPANANPPVIERRAPVLPPAPRVVVAPGTSSSTTTTTVITEQRPPVSAEADAEGGGFFTRAGRTLDHTHDTVQRSIEETNATVKRSLKRTGATIQRFFVGHSDLDKEDANPE